MTSPPEPLLPALGARVRCLRLAAGLTQAELAAAAGMNPRTVGRVELGCHAVSVVGLQAIARVLGVTAGRLLD